MKNSAYWQKRFELLEQSQNKMGVQCYAELEKQYRKAQRQLEGQITAWYGRFATNNGITIQEARKLLTTKELAELKWDVREYIKYGEENALNGTWVKELENASAKFHISRLEALKLQTQQQLEVLFGNQLDVIDSTMREVYKSSFYRTAFEIQKGFSVGWDMGTLDDKKISKVLSKPWAVDGKNFSSRVWDNRTKLVSELNNTLVQDIMLGKDPKKTIETISKKLNSSKVATGKLVMTEQAFFSSAAQKDCFAELDVEQFEVVATLDNRTSDICQEMDGKHFPMSQYEVGVTAPPFHPWCRSCTCPYFGDEFDLIGERSARGEDGKVYYVPNNMTYPEWKKSFVDGGSKTDLQEIKPDDKIKVTETHWSDMEQGDTFTTKKEAFKHFEDLGIKMGDSKKYPMDGDVATAFANWHSKFIKNFADFDNAIVNKLPSIRNVAPSTLGAGVLGDFTYYTSDEVVGIRLNSEIHCWLEYAKKKSAASFERHWHSSPNPIHTMIHEYGHYVSHSMGCIERGFEHKIIKQTIEEYKKTHTDYVYETYIGLSDALSRYGTKSEAECFAEAFAEYFGSDEPREFATIFGHLLEKAMKGVK